MHNIHAQFCPISLEFKNSLSVENQDKVRDISFGNIFTNEPNGFIFESPFGVCSTISHSLRYFIQFASLALMDFGDKVPMKVRFQAMRIAIRIMLEKEALDFDLDPRGIIPEDIQKAIYHPYPHIASFIAGHEYSHYLNGDIRNGDTTPKSLFKAHFADDTDYKKINCYNTKQIHEFRADEGAMNYPLFSEDYYGLYYNYVMLWFAMLAIYESVEDTVFPAVGSTTHPGAKARYNNLLQNARRPNNFPEYEEYYCKTLPEIIDFWSKLMQEDVSENFELYEMYGSVYLSAPNTPWRGRPLIDRLDY